MASSDDQSLLKIKFSPCVLFMLGQCFMERGIHCLKNLFNDRVYNEEINKCKNVGFFIMTSLP